MTIHLIEFIQKDQTHVSADNALYNVHIVVYIQSVQINYLRQHNVL